MWRGGKEKVDTSCMHMDERRTEHMEGRCLPPPLFLLTCSLCPFFLLKRATCIMTKICIFIRRAGELLQRLQLKRRWTLAFTSLWKNQVKLKAGRLCRSSMGNWLYKARTIIWVTSDTFPPIPADILPPSCRDLRLHAESLRLNIDAHLLQQHGSGSAGERWTKSHTAELKSSAACFTKQNRQPYGCLVLSAQPPWEMVFVRVIKLSHNPITSVIFMIQSLCLAGQLDKC